MRSDFSSVIDFPSPILLTTGESQARRSAISTFLVNAPLFRFDSRAVMVPAILKHGAPQRGPAVDVPASLHSRCKHRAQIPMMLYDECVLSTLTHLRLMPWRAACVRYLQTPGQQLRRSVGTCRGLALRPHAVAATKVCPCGKAPLLWQFFCR